MDSEKLRSFSSQLFEGVTEQIVLSAADAAEKHETQRGPPGSGRVLASIFAQDKSSTELRFLEDHAYTLFEEHLIDQALVDIVCDQQPDALTGKSFIKVTAGININDIAASSKLLKEFNEFGEAFWRVGNESMSATSSAKVLPDGEARKRAAAEGLQLNKKVADAAGRLLDFGYGDLIEAHARCGVRLFSAPLKRQFLRESEAMIVHKYSRLTQREFTMLGLITQRGDTHAVPEELPEIKDANGMKETMRTLSLHLSSVERSFSGISSTEIVIDPIAIYSVI